MANQENPAEPPECMHCGKPIEVVRERRQRMSDAKPGTERVRRCTDPGCETNNPKRRTNIRA